MFQWTTPALNSIRIVKKFAFLPVHIDWHKPHEDGVMTYVWLKFYHERQVYDVPAFPSQIDYGYRWFTIRRSLNKQNVE